MRRPELTGTETSMHVCRLIDVLEAGSDPSSYKQQLEGVFQGYWLAVHSPAFLCFEANETQFPQKLTNGTGFLALKFSDVRLDVLTLTGEPVAEGDDFSLDETHVGVFRRPKRPRGDPTIIDWFPEVGIDLQQEITILVR